jgi:Mrp family chromosome partitioning ATPase
VTSPLPTDGKTFTAANLAAVMAQGGQRVILVDADLRRPMQHRLFGLPREPGLTSCMLAPPADPADPADPTSARLLAGDEGRLGFLRETQVDGLRVLPSGERAPNPAELLASRRFKLFVSWLKKQADVLVFDSPPTLAVTDASLLANMVDGTLLVLDAGQTRRPAAVRAVERLNDVGANVLGVVLNRLGPSSDGYYYYYYYHGGYYTGEDGRDEKEVGWLGRLLGKERGARRRERHKSHSAEAQRGGERDA